MGSFIGHVIPGSFFIGFAIWWMIDTLMCYYKPENDRKQFRSRIISYVTVCQGRRRVALMSWLVVVLTGLGIVVEMILSPARAKHSPGAGNIQHATMYFCFGLVGLQNLVIDCCPTLPQRRHIEYITITLALVVEALLFKFHLAGRSEIDVMMHTLLLYAIYASILVVLLEIYFEKSLMLALGRSYFTMVQGTWFMQLAFSLYNPKHDPWGHHLNSEAMEQSKTSSHHHVSMQVASIFSWHLGTVFIIYMSIFLAYHRRYKPNNGIEYRSLTMANKDERYDQQVHDLDDEEV